MNMSALAQELGISRQWLHTLRTKDPQFPQAQRKTGSTRDLFDREEVKAYYRSRLREPGRRTDREIASAVLRMLNGGSSAEMVSRELGLAEAKVHEIAAAERARKKSKNRSRDKPA